jgi:hypothetical protein
MYPFGHLRRRARSTQFSLMYLLVEAWTPKPTWLALPRAERQAYVSQVGSGAAALQAAGIETLGWGFIDEAARGTEHLAFAIWQCPSQEAAQQLRQAIAESGWYDYFDQLDFGGEAGSPEAVLRQHLNAEPTTA